LRKIILDTDIGTDVDDAMALLYLLNHKDVEVLGISTAYGDTQLRGQIVSHYLELLGRQIPIYAGATQTLSGREIYISGEEGSSHGNLSRYPKNLKNSVDFMIDAVNTYPKQIEILGIAPLTNIALAIQHDNSFAANVKHLQIMGGDFARDFAEHNFKSDVDALRVVMQSGIPTTIVPLNITRQVAIPISDFEFLNNLGPGQQLLFSQIKNWLEFRNESVNNPHDPISALALLNPEIFTFSQQGKIESQLEAGELVLNRFIPSTNGTVRIVQEIDVSRAINALFRGLYKQSS
jgi:purine nucleosidase